ncbi:hypothetical protein [Pengzhenrongella frigida]|uniref:Chemotaxis methyl-accepting receptor HlyB-like 4HB MCP domain-containing protein n=1 Tax=Pengzhenrongella frigida TaxID=1259133 RepID=A0A4Q5N105_9MICO|nr:hypothetical protein [Cellulomonas sp. HLT2-17]RYV50923.1 hypothetical protein EUA98_11080 [Cellulomonas sp. HLT2-17]
MTRTAPTTAPASARPGADPYASPLPTVASPAARAGQRMQRARLGVQGTPGRMRLVSAALVVVGLLVGLAAAQSFSVADGALVRADRNAAQLVRLQDIQTLLVRADADATNAFVVGGLEPADQRADYDEAVDRAVQQVAFAARAQPADGEALAALSSAIQSYTSGVVQARAANRQGLPLGAQYLREASAGLRADALPLLGALTSANEERVQTEFDTAGRAQVLALVAGLLGLVIVAGALVWLARRTHRYVNVPVAGAGVVILVVLVASVVALGSVAAAVADLRAGSYASARALAGARIAAFDAKANESLTLVSRGSGAAFEAAWQESSAVTSSLVAEAAQIDPAAADLPGGWDAYTALHQEIRSLDDGGGWEQAVAAAISREPGSANATFDAFDAASGEQLTAASEATSSGLRDARSGLALAGWLCGLAGVLAALLAWWGLSQRIEEYR